MASQQGRRQERKPPSETQKARALVDFWEFVDLINYQGGSKRFGDVHRELVSWHNTQHKGECDRFLTLMPRGHLKSTIMSVGRVLWRVYQNPNIRIFVGTATGALATSFVREIKMYFEDPWLQDHVWNARPHIKGNMIPTMDKLGRSRRKQMEEDGDFTEAEDKKVVWRANALQVVRSDILREPTIVVGSVGAQATGMHFDELQLDDVVTYDNISTPDKRDRLMNWIYDLESVLDPVFTDERIYQTIMSTRRVKAEEAQQWQRVGGYINVVGTRYDLEDYYNHIIEGGDDLGFAVFQRNIYVNGSDSSEGYLWPEKWNEALDKKTRKNMTATRFASQYLNQILAAEDTILKMDNVTYIHPSDVEPQDDGSYLIRVKFQEAKVRVRFLMVVDPAAAVGKDADYTAIVVGGRDEHNNLYVVDVDAGKWKSEEILKHIYKLADKWRLRSVCVESVGGFKHFVEYFRQSFSRYRPIGIIEYQPQGNKQMRIANALEPLFTNGMVFMMTYLGGNKLLTDQMSFFPRETMHDDIPDAIAALAEMAKKPVKQVVNRPRRNRNTSYGGHR